MTNSSVSATTSTMISEMTERMIFLRVSGVAPGLSQAMVRSRPRAMRRARSTLVIIDEDGVYDPASPNDRLLLGMKGTMSEMELSVFRQRSIEAMKQKAGRGELFLTVAVGYVKGGHDNIEKDPDRRVQEAVALVFRKFTELQTIKQVLG